MQIDLNMISREDAQELSDVGWRFAVRNDGEIRFCGPREFVSCREARDERPELWESIALIAIEPDLMAV